MDNKVLYLLENKQGKDLICGDIHGCFEDLLLALKAIGFDERVDRLLVVGDLIDRGPDSVGCVSLLDKDWVYSVRGNHEDLMIKSVLHNNPQATLMWLQNGGRWIYDTGTWKQKYTQEQLVQLANKLDELPLVIVVGEGENRFNIVHAEFYRTGYVLPEFQHGLLPIGDSDIDKWTFTPNEEHNMMWGRNLIQRPHTSDNIAQMYLSQTFVGHTPVFQLVRCFQHIYIDLGCVYHYMGTRRDTQALAIACPQDQVVYSWSPTWKKLTSRPITEIPTIQDTLQKIKVSVT